MAMLINNTVRLTHQAELHPVSLANCNSSNVINEKAKVWKDLRNVWGIWGGAREFLYPLNYKSVFSVYSFLLKSQADFSLLIIQVH